MYVCMYLSKEESVVILSLLPFFPFPHFNNNTLTSWLATGAQLFQGFSMFFFERARALSSYKARQSHKSKTPLYIYNPKGEILTNKNGRDRSR
jgi:hypothetical protein